MQPIETPAIITGISVRADQSLTVRLHTQELSTEAKAKLMEYMQQPGWFLFRTDRQWSETELPENESGMKKASPSQRLRMAIYGRYKAEGAKCSFQQYYEATMADLIHTQEEHYI